jgi:ABC-type glycerol-3-phosphate transport system permease component
VTLRSVTRDIRRHLLIYAGLAPFVVFAIFPVYWMAITAFKQDADLYPARSGSSTRGGPWSSSIPGSRSRSARGR